MKIEDLKKLSDKMDYKTRVWPWGKSLAYIDARQAQDRLDEVCGIENWKVEYKEHRWELFAWVSIKLGGEVWEAFEWVTKWDWWSETKIEWEKWVISDSFKRACVVWGLWRFLYSIKPTNTWTAPKKENNDNLPWYNDFDKHITFYVEQLKSWKTAQDIINKLTEKYKVNKEVRQSIKDLEADNK